MATILTSSQQTFVDITDQRKLSAYITSNLPKTQSENPNVLPHTYAPSWAVTNLKFIRCVRIIYQLETKRWNRGGKCIDRRRNRGRRNPYRK